jgi:hypothetical protein
VRELAERACFALSRALGRLLRSARYARVQLVFQSGEPRVRKHRVIHAPLLVCLGGPLMRVLDAGVRILPQSEWTEREQIVCRRLRGTAIRIDDRMLTLPLLAGRTLAALLEDPELAERSRNRAIERSVVALAEFHHLGFTHGDAMAENVVVDLEGGEAHWIDFETIHDPRRPLTWRRADDVRALLTTSLIRTPPARRPETLQLILDAYADEGVTRVLAASFMTVWQRPLAFHLAQAGLSLACFREIGRLLRERIGESPASGRLT